MTKDILFLITGGTIDSAYYPPTETPEPNAHSILPEYLENTVKSYLDLQIQTVCMKDSGDLTLEDRQEILHRIQHSSCDKILITHGTTAMTITQDFLHDHRDQLIGKTIVLTGSMIPLKEFAMSDAGFNLGFALAILEYLKPGVYIAMHGQIFEPGKVSKNTDIARFEERD